MVDELKSSQIGGLFFFIYNFLVSLTQLSTWVYQAPLFHCSPIISYSKADSLSIVIEEFQLIGSFVQVVMRIGQI